MERKDVGGTRRGIQNTKLIGPSVVRPRSPRLAIHFQLSDVHLRRSKLVRVPSRPIVQIPSAPHCSSVGSESVRLIRPTDYLLA